jgi:hypothetical protein
MDCSRLALVFADLAAFSAETLAALALSQASTEAFTSSSKADIRARAVTKAAASKGKDISNMYKMGTSK